MIAHHTLGGCNLRPGDLLGSGTISTGGPGQRGCLLEATSGGKESLFLRPLNQQLPQNIDDTAEGDIIRTYLEDGDTVVMSGWCENSSGEQISFGACRGAVLPSHDT
jgi:fumarylacetoacetase